MSGLDLFDKRPMKMARKRQSYVPEAKKLGRAQHNNLLSKAQLSNTTQTMADFSGGTTKNTFNTLATIHNARSAFGHATMQSPAQHPNSRNDPNYASKQSLLQMIDRGVRGGAMGGNAFLAPAN